MVYERHKCNKEEIAEAVAKDAKYSANEVNTNYLEKSEESVKVDSIFFGLPISHYSSILPVKHLLENEAKVEVQLQADMGTTVGFHAGSAAVTQFNLEMLKYLDVRISLRKIYSINRTKLNSKSEELTKLIAQKTTIK